MARVWVSEYTPEEQRFQAFAILELTPVQDSCCLRCLSHANILCSPEWCYHILSHPVKQTKLNNLYPSTTNNSTCTQRGERLITPFILGRGQERKGAELVFGRQCLRKQSLELWGFRSYMSETLWSCCRIAQVLVLARRKRQPKIKPAMFCHPDKSLVAPCCLGQNQRSFSCTEVIWTVQRAASSSLRCSEGTRTEVGAPSPKH